MTKQLPHLKTYEKNWPILDCLTIYLKNASDQSRKAALKDAKSSEAQKKSVSKGKHAHFNRGSSIPYESEEGNESDSTPNEGNH